MKLIAAFVAGWAGAWLVVFLIVHYRLVGFTSYVHKIYMPQANGLTISSPKADGWAQITISSDETATITFSDIPDTPTKKLSNSQPKSGVL